MKRKTMEHLAILQISLSIGQNLDNERMEIPMNLTPVSEQWLKDTGVKQANAKADRRDDRKKG
jgi:hypothetical protein